MGHFSKNKIHLKLSMKLNFPNMHYICPNFEPNIFMQIGNGWADNVLVTVWFEACWAAPNYHDPYSGESVVTDFHRLDNSALTAAGIGMKSLDGSWVYPEDSIPSLTWQKMVIPGIDTIHSSPCLCDLNQTEHLWDIILLSIWSCRIVPETIQELSYALVQIWEEIAQDTTRDLIRSIPWFHRACVSACRSHREYRFEFLL